MQGIFLSDFKKFYNLNFLSLYIHGNFKKYFKTKNIIFKTNSSGFKWLQAIHEKLHIIYITHITHITYIHKSYSLNN